MEFGKKNAAITETDSIVDCTTSETQTETTSVENLTTQQETTASIVYLSDEYIEKFDDIGNLLLIIIGLVAVLIGILFSNTGFGRWLK